MQLYSDQKGLDTTFGFYSVRHIPIRIHSHHATRPTLTISLALNPQFRLLHRPSSRRSLRAPVRRVQRHHIQHLRLQRAAVLDVGSGGYRRCGRVFAVVWVL